MASFRLGGSSLRAVLFSFALIILVPQRCDGALNIETYAADDMVSELRQSIFIETQHLEERQEQRCSSLDGPRCFMIANGLGSGASSTTWGEHVSAPGVIPEMMLWDLGINHNDFNFTTPDYHTLQYYYQQHKQLSSQHALPKLLAGTDDVVSLREARGAAERGILHFTDVVPGSHIQLSFSSGLPSGVVATWDGRWIARDCEARPSQQFKTLALPATDEKPSDPHAPVLAGRVSSTVASTVAELAGTVGYLRFSRPVIIRSLLARWHPSDDAVPAIIGGRLGLDATWTSHLDPRLPANIGWRNVGGDALQPIDEIAFIAAKGLEVGAIDVVAYGGEGIALDQRSVLLLAPVPPGSVAPVEGSNEDVQRPTFSLKLETLSPAAAPFVVSVQEAIDRNLRFRAKPASFQNAIEPAEVSSLSLEKRQREMVWRMMSQTNQAMFDHKLLAHQQLPSLVGGSSTSAIRPRDAFARALSLPSNRIPRDLRKELAREQDAIVEALTGFLQGGSRWSKMTPSTLPQQGSEEALARYMTAKRWQTKFDLLTAAFLHASSERVLQGAQAALAKNVDFAQSVNFAQS